jgi:hypothetical protein
MTKEPLPSLYRERIAMLLVVAAVSIALSTAGIILFALGRIKLSERRIVDGIPARIMGLLLMATFPVILGTGLVLEWLLKKMSGNPPREPAELITAGMPAVLFGLFLLSSFLLIVGTCSRTVEPSWADDEKDDYKEEDYPLRRRRRDDRFRR